MNLAHLSSALMPALRLIDAEEAHGLALRGLRLGLAGRSDAPDHPALGVRALGLAFDNPVGLAAGFDKDARAVLPVMRLGFGFVEAGTVTLRPQGGNPRPRVFRLARDRAIINRLGFNNAGIEAFVGNVRALADRPARLGANVGINKDAADPERDYPSLVAAVTPYVDYVTINVSSPNTPGLRDLQGQAQLRAILRAIAAQVPVRPPLLVKLAPDLSEGDLAAAVEAAVEHGANGLILSNTTVARPAGLSGPNANQAGGLSGTPLFARSTEMLRMAARLSAGRLTLVGCGGVQSGADVLAKIQAGASLVQIYTAFAYEGPVLVTRLKAELLAAMRERGFASIEQARATAL
jgi:dihydroorotate dehydrogenase